MDTRTIQSRYGQGYGGGYFAIHLASSPGFEEARFLLVSAASTKRRKKDWKELSCACSCCQSPVAGALRRRMRLTREEDDVRCPNYNTHRFRRGSQREKKKKNKKKEEGGRLG
ncbi:unnamed protein product [Prunus armeniaca]